MPKFRKKPVEVEAIHYDGTNWDQLRDFLGEEMWSHLRAVSRTGDGPAAGYIMTLDGTMTASVGDWIIRDVRGEFYPCRPDAFAATYEAVEA